MKITGGCGCHPSKIWSECIICTGWWFQALWKILVSRDCDSQYCICSKPSLTQHWNPYPPMRLTKNLQEMGCIDPEGVLFWTGVHWWFRSIWKKKNWHHPNKGFKTKRQHETTKHDYLYINSICAKVKTWSMAYGCVWMHMVYSHPFHNGKHDNRSIKLPLKGLMIIPCVGIPSIDRGSTTRRPFIFQSLWLMDVYGKYNKYTIVGFITPIPMVHGI